MKIAILSNPYVKAELKAKLLNGIISCKDFECKEIEDFSLIDSSFDRILVFGGDGTILRAIKATSSLEIPILGIDLGTLGFLAEFDSKSSVDNIIEALKSNKILDKMLLEFDFIGKKYNALNEVVVKSSTSKPIYLDLYVDGEFVDSYHSDGIIVASPTGSTAYSLSAGGPVLAPGVDAMSIIPICPHSLHSKALVVSSTSNVEIVIRKYLDANVSVDGEVVGQIRPNEKLLISKSKLNAKFIVVNNKNFYSRLLDKMNKWGTTED